VLELSIPAQFAFMFMLLMLGNREFNRLKDIESMSWSNILSTVAMVSIANFAAGVFLFEAIVEIIHMPMG